jgi:hypothetical protein
MSACASGANIVSVEANELAIVQVEIEHSSDHGDPLLLIRGFDAGDREVASFTLRTGSVLYSYGSDPGSLPEQQTLGRELDITVGGEAQHFTKASKDAWDVQPGFFSARSNQFIRLVPVAAAIEDEAAIRLLPAPAPSDEVAYAYTTCTASKIPTGTTLPHCCAWGTNYDALQASTDPANTLRYRNYSTPCTTSGGSTSCGFPSGTMCDYGPAGGFTGPANSSSYPYRTSGTDQCATYTGPGFPADFSSYADSVSGSSPWLLCRAGGIPANTLNVTTSGGVGSVWSSSSGISISGTGSGSAVFGSVTIFASDDFRTTFIQMSGACSASGFGSVSCSPDMSGGVKNLSVAFSP